MTTRRLTGALLWAALLILATSLPGGLRPSSPPPALAQAPQAVAPAASEAAALRPASDAALIRLARLRIVWGMIDRHYVYADFRGRDWEAVRARYEPLALAAPDDASFHRLLAAMVAELADGHTRYLAPAEAGEADQVAAGSHTYPGVGILTVARPEALVVLEVLSGSPAEAAGLRRRDQILAVDGHPWALDCGEPCAVRGPERTRVSLTVRSSDGATREVTLMRAPVRAALAVSAARLDAAPSVGYLRIPTLQSATSAAQVEAGLRELLADGPLGGLVLDLRRNGGGRRSQLLGVLGQFVDGEHGAFFSRRGTAPLVVSAGSLRADLAAVPVVVLVDERTASAAETLAGVLQTAGRACVVGGRTAGNVELVYAYTLDDGSRLLLAREGLRLRDGVILDERGVAPDVPVEADWALFSERDDPYIARALAALAEGACGSAR
ncbi:MAG TPA: S41 family peptidase [Chloroflexaceae bacterium]|nr:S41 family peptidase [Chloroflexaceae bacterium]